MRSLIFDRVSFAHAGGDEILRDLSLTFTPGWTAIVGDNGAGKSTLLGLAGGTLAPTRGTIRRTHLTTLAVVEQRVDLPGGAVAALAASHDRDAASWRARFALDPTDLDRWETLSPGERKGWEIDRPVVVMNQPVDEFVASFVGTETVLTGRIKESHRGTIVIRVNSTEIEAVRNALPGEEVVLRIRPENVTLAMSRDEKTTSARNAFMGRIERIVPMGLFHRVHLDCGFPLVAYVTSQSLENLGLIEDLQVAASVKATAIHVIRQVRSALSPS